MKRCLCLVVLSYYVAGAADFLHVKGSSLSPTEGHFKWLNYEEIGFYKMSYFFCSSFEMILITLVFTKAFFYASLLDVSPLVVFLNI